MTIDEFYRQEYAKMGFPMERFEKSFLEAKALFGGQATRELTQDEIDQLEAGIAMIKLIAIAHPEGKKVIGELKDAISETLIKAAKVN